MIEWLQNNWLPLVIVIAFLFGMLFYIIKSKGLRKAATDAIVWVEKAYETEEGKVKMQKAIDYIQQLVPFLNLVPDSLIHSFVQDVFDQIKVALDHEPKQKKEKIEKEITEDVKILDENLKEENEG